MTLEEALILTCCAVVFAFLLPFVIHWWQTRRDDHKPGSEGVEEWR